MMHSITNDRAKTDNGTKYTGIRILAVLFWIAIWQFASMYLKQEILLASPVSVVQKLFELIFSRNFWYSVGFSFVRIVTGFLLAVFLGIFLAILAYWSKTVEILIAPVIAVVKSTPVASFIILCLIWIPSRNLSVFISFLMVLPVIYTNILEGIRQTDRKILEMAKVFRVNLRRQIRYIYVSQVLPYFLVPDMDSFEKSVSFYFFSYGSALFSLCMQAFTWDVLESRSGSRGYRSTFRFYW